MRRILAVLVLACLLAIPVAARSLPDLEQTGSISVAIRYDGAAVSGGTLTLYRVGDIQEADGNYSFILAEPFAASGITLENLHAADTAAKLFDFAQRKGFDGTTGKISAHGKLTFADLQPGLYLLAQRKAAEGYQKLSPFLVTLPMRTADGYTYQVDAGPKVSPVPAQPENTQQPATGQPVWPIWTFLFSAAALTALGYCRKTRYHHHRS